MATYRQLMDAQALVADARAAAGVAESTIEAAYDACESSAPEQESEQELYLGTLTRFIEQLGGRLEGLTAVFQEGRVALPPLRTTDQV